MTSSLPSTAPHAFMLAMASYAETGKSPRTLTEREQRLLLKVTGEHRAGFRDHLLSLIKRDPRKKSVAGKKRLAMWNPRHALELLTYGFQEI